MSEERTSFEPGLDLRWWKYDGDALTSSISQTIQQILVSQVYKRESDWRYARMYGNYAGYGAQGSPIARSGLWSGALRLSLNVIKNMCGAATSKITKTRPKPFFITSGGDYDLQKRAKQLTKFSEGQFYEVGLYDLAPTVFLDACIYGTGIMKIYREEGFIKCERVFPWELMVDQSDGRDGRPRQMYQMSPVDKLVLAELFPDHRQKIIEAPLNYALDYELGDTSLTGYLSNLIQVREAWHLPSGKDAKDGRHVIAIEGCVLLDEEYEKDYFPFAIMRWSPAPVGFWGIGIAEELTGIQIEINSLLRSIQQAHHLIGKGHWMVENSSKVLSTYLDNEIGSIIKYTGVAPTIYAPSPVAPEIYQHLWALYGKAYEIVGISQLTAQSQKPAGLDSGVALRTFADIQTERFVVVSREYEQFFLETARQMIELARELAEEDPGYSVKLDGGRSFERIAWKDVHLEEDEYVLKMFPVSALSDDPASKMQQVQELMQGGLIDQQTGMRLLDFPDLESEFDDVFASDNLIKMLISRMVEDGTYKSPEPFMNLTRAIEKTQMAYMHYETQGVPREHLDLLLQFLSDCASLQEAGQAPAATPQGPPPEGAPGQPMPPGGQPGAAPEGMPLPGGMPSPATPPIPVGTPNA